MKSRMLFAALAVCSAVIGVDAVMAAQKARVLRPVAGAPPVATAKAPDRPAASEDFYYYGKEPVRLERSSTEAVVMFRPGTPEARLTLLQEISPSATLGDEAANEGRTFQIVKSTSAGLRTVMDQLRGKDEVQFVAAVLHYPKTRTRMLPTDEIVVKLRAGGTREELAGVADTLGLKIVRTMWRTPDEFVLRLNDPKTANPLERARTLYETGRFAWAEPNFIREYKKSSAPNDPLFSQQWHLNNTGQSGGTIGADVDASAAWDLQQGSSAITIAIVDDGVEKTHEDLASNIFVNAGETAGNGIDDDGNGYIDDVSGWDFNNSDNDPSPFSVDDNHGTAVAGVAAARGNNALGVSGACQTCKILPVKVFSPGFAGDTAAGNAIRYAGSLADVVNNSWGGGAPSSAIQSAIQFATTSGRGGKGSAVLFATGNDASGMFTIDGPVLPAGTHRFRWTYSKDVSLEEGDDTTWLAWAVFPGGQLVTFESGIPAGWTTGGNSSWTAVIDPTHSDEGRCFVRAAKAGPLTHNQSNYLEVVKTLPSGSFFSYQWVSSEFDFDGLDLEIDLNNNGSIDLSTGLISGVPDVDFAVAYPAAYPESIGVGASSNFDCRSDYSQFGAELAFVSPSSAGPLNLAIQTTDRTGSAGYDATSYTSDFGGTSSATPLASGIAGLLLSRNPSLTLTQIRQAMQNTAEKVGPEPYVAGRNNRYGYGRLNANLALASVTSCAAISLSPAAAPGALTNNFYILNVVASGGTGIYTFAVSAGSLPPGLTLSDGIISGTPTTIGNYSFSITATDTNGCSGYKAYNVPVTVGSAPTGTSFYTLTPCRIIDTRLADGPFGGPAIPTQTTRDIQITGQCGVPASAKSIALNVTSVTPLSTGYMAFFPTGSPWPGNSTINYRSAKTRANNAIVRLSASGKITAYNVGSTLHFIIDVAGYFE